MSKKELTDLTLYKKKVESMTEVEIKELQDTIKKEERAKIKENDDTIIKELDEAEKNPNKKDVAVIKKKENNDRMKKEKMERERLDSFHDDYVDYPNPDKITDDTLKKEAEAVKAERDTRKKNIEENKISYLNEDEQKRHQK